MPSADLAVVGTVEHPQALRAGVRDFAVGGEARSMPEPEFCAALLAASLIVARVCVVFLRALRSALVAILILPVGMNFHPMSLGGSAIGAMIDAAIVMIENAHKHPARLPAQHAPADRADAMLSACREVGPALSFLMLFIRATIMPAARNPVSQSTATR